MMQIHAFEGKLSVWFQFRSLCAVIACIACDCMGFLRVLRKPKACTIDWLETLCSNPLRSWGFFLCEGYMFSLCSCGFSLGTLPLQRHVSGHKVNCWLLTDLRWELECVQLFVSICWPFDEQVVPGGPCLLPKGSWDRFSWRSRCAQRSSSVPGSVPHHQKPVHCCSNVKYKACWLTAGNKSSPSLHPRQW